LPFLFSCHQSEVTSSVKFHKSQKNFELERSRFLDLRRYCYIHRTETRKHPSFPIIHFSAKNQISYCQECRISYQKIFLPCGGHHDRQNPNWKAFQLLERNCDERGYDFYKTLDMVQEWIGRKLICECELLRN
jgi:hypothetical protein